MFDDFSVEQKHFPNYGYSISKFPDEITSVLKKEIQEIKKNVDKKEKIYKNLAGHLETQVYLETSQQIIQPYLLEMAAQYIRAWNFDKEISQNYLIKKPLSFMLEKVWINFQKKYEFNPLHNHSGVFSFVSWIDIPYSLEEELTMPHVTPADYPLATSFNFVFTNILGDVQSLPFFPDKTCEGTVLFFPSTIKHLVYPFFTSNENRVSISGNLFVAD
jgi:hypothetical protein